MFENIYILRLILFNLEDKDLFSLLQVNKKIQIISGDDYFWQQKIVEKWGGQVVKLKPADISYKQQYQTVHIDMFDYKQIIKENRADKMWINSNKLSFTGLNFICRAARKGNLFMLKFLLDLWPNATKNMMGSLVDVAAGSGNIIMVSWLLNQGYNGDKAISNAIQKNKPEMMYWLYSQGYKPSIIDIIAATQMGNLDLLKWFKSLDISFDSEYINLADIAASFGHLEILKWYKGEGILATSNGADEAAKNGHLDVLIWLTNEKIFPIINEDLFKEVAERGHLDVLKWLIDHGCKVNQEAINNAAVNGHIHILEYFNMLPDKTVLNKIVKNGHLDVLILLDKHGFIYSEDTASMAAGEGQINILNWLAQKNIYPDPIVIVYLYTHERLSNGIDILEWFYQKNLLPKFPPNYFYETKTRNWLKQKGLI